VTKDKKMTDFDYLLTILDSADDVVAASEWSQSLEPTPMRLGDQVDFAHHSFTNSEHCRVTLYPKYEQVDDGNRLEEFVLAYDTGGDKVIQGGLKEHTSYSPVESTRKSFFFNDSDYCRWNNNSSGTKLLASGSIALVQSTADSPDNTAPSTPRKMDLILGEEVIQSSDQGNQAALVSPTSSMSDVGGYAAESFCSSRFRSYQVGQWQERFEELLLFGKAYGHLLVPHCYPPNQKLAQWVKRQRHQYKRKNMGHHSTLSDGRVQLLLDAGFVFDSHKAVWYLRYQTLKAFHNVHGHCNIPTDFRDVSLTVWLKHQRRQYLLYQKGVKNTMNEERIQLLDSIGLDWNPRNLVKSCPPAKSSTTS
jgi:hypothetical protein